MTRFDWYAWAIMLTLVIMLGVAGNIEHADASTPQRGTPEYCIAHAAGVVERKCIVRVMWYSRGQSRKALSVASCETGGTFSPSILGPRDEYGNRRIGVWQFGTRERRVFGPYGTTVKSQTAAAIRYYDYNRRRGVWGWSPWTCA